MTAADHAAALPPGSAERAAVQARTLRVLMVSQALAGAGVSSAFAVGGVLAEDLTGSTILAGVATAGLSVGSASATVPLAGLMARSGRRPGLRLGYSIAAVGAAGAAVAGATRWAPLVFVSILLLGVASATNLASRFAAADLAEPDERAAAIGRLVWATTVGVVTGPTLVSQAGRLAEWLGTDELVGPFMFSVVFLALSAVNIEGRLRPDPLVVAGGLGERSEPRLAMVQRTGRAILANRQATLAVAAMAVAHLVMVGVMTMTPVYMEEFHSVRVIGLVISAHTLGMYAFSPLVGRVVDGLGQHRTIGLGGAVLVISTVVSGTASDDGSTTPFFLGLFLLGIGWSFGLIAGSSLLVDSFPVEERAAVQGTADLVMTVAGSVGGLSSGFVLTATNYTVLNAAAGVFAAALLVIAAVQYFRTGPATPDLAG